ncbi:MAG: DUF1800 domain-containing protein [Xenococcaceae cyanobacterium MO_167.B27]|nr:DUF1800 domain-containing protein [Xenococcaceae cyanobacterium MO_167.B27]
MKKSLQNWCILFVSVALLWLGILPYPQAIGADNQDKVNHYISRMSFGVTPGQISKVQASGIENYLQAQLNPESIPESRVLELRLAELDTISRNPVDLFQYFEKYRLYHLPNQGANLSEAEKKEFRRKRSEFRRKVTEQVQQANLLRSILSERQLQEVMVNFWFNHFNVASTKRVTLFWLADYENDIRTHALGNFRDLLATTAHHPAMLIYLDNDLNVAPNNRARGNLKGINENYARELMELHSLGVDGGYTQQDVIALAKILTGWGVDGKNNSGDENGFRFYRRRHDFSDKVFLGQTIAGTGIEEGEKALDILATHPSTARFISYKLAQYFVADEPPNSLVDRLADKFLASNGNIKTVLDTLFHSPEFNDPQYYDNKFNNPYQYLVSILRASNIDNPNFKRLRGMLAQLSMPLYNCVTPDGYTNTKDPWLNPEGMLRRVSFANAIANGTISNKQPVNAQQLEKTLGNKFSATTQNAISQSPPRLRSTLILGSPEMMNR